MNLIGETEMRLIGGVIFWLIGIRDKEQKRERDCITTVDSRRHTAERINFMWTRYPGYFGAYYKPNPPSVSQISKTLYIAEMLGGYEPTFD